MQQHLLFSYTFVHVFGNIFIRVIKQNQANCYYEKKSYCYPPDIPFFTHKEDNCVNRRQKSAMIISPVQEKPEKKLESQGAVMRTMSKY